ncbi:hypothetical protein HN51_065234 [Arachis hypogaea]
MFHSASVQQEHGLVHDFVSHIGRFAFDSRFFTFGSDNCALALSNYLHFNVTKQSVCSAASLSLKLGGRGDSNLNFRRFLMISTQLLGSDCQEEFTQLVKTRNSSQNDIGWSEGLIR